jgi:hypothetical protein
MLRARALRGGRPGSPHQPDDHHLRLWSPRDQRRDCEERRPDGGHGTLLPQALRTPRYQGLEYRSQPARAGLTRRGFLSCPHNCTGFWGGSGPRQPGFGRELPLSDRCPTTYGGTISSARGATGAQRRSEAPTSEQVSEYGTPVKARPWCVRQNGRSQRVHVAPHGLAVDTGPVGHPPEPLVAA